MPQQRRVVGERWELIRLLAEGGMGTVYTARHLVTGRHAALKLLDDYAADSVAIERFRREAAITAELGHPGIVEVLDAGYDVQDRTFFIAMELLEGATLQDKMSCPTVSPARTLELVYDLLEALGAAHERGVIHRDLKPANVFVVGGEVERTKLLDFGIARKTGAKGMTQTGTSMGTPYYMSPEQAMDARRVSKASDIWSIGVMLYEGITGVLPFGGQTSHAVIVAACTEDPVPITTYAPEVDPRLNELVLRCLCREPEGRPADAAALRAALAPLVATPSLPSSRPMSLVPSIAPTSSQVRPRPLRPAPMKPESLGLGLMGALCVAGAAFATAFGVASGHDAMLPWLLGPFLGGSALLGLGALSLRRSRNAQEADTGPMLMAAPLGTLGPAGTHAPCRGSTDATVTLLVFGDLAEADSRKASAALTEVLESYEGKVRVVWKNLAGSSEAAKLAAEATLESFTQGGDEAFWGMHDHLLRNPRALAADKLEAHAEKLGLHTVSFRYALEVGRHRESLAADREMAEALGVRRAPALFIDGERMEEAITIAGLHHALEARFGGAQNEATPMERTLPAHYHKRMGLRSVLIQWRGAAGAKGAIIRSRRDARERALKIRNRAQMPETNWDLLARRFGDTSADFGVAPLGRLAPELREEAASLHLGQVSELLETASGFYVLKRYA